MSARALKGLDRAPRRIVLAESPRVFLMLRFLEAGLIPGTRQLVAILHSTQAMKPLSLKRPIWTIARLRPMVASEPKSR